MEWEPGEVKKVLVKWDIQPQEIVDDLNDPGQQRPKLLLSSLSGELSVNFVSATPKP